MNRGLAIWFVVVVAPFAACHRDESRSETSTVCSESWYRMIDEKVPTGDSEGHGPDVGSDEWKSVVEFKLGIRGEPDVPKRDTEAWCQHVDQLVQRGRIDAAGGAVTGGHMSEMLDIVLHDPRWPIAFEAERDRIAAALGTLALRIDHNGSAGGAPGGSISEAA